MMTGDQNDYSVCTTWLTYKNDAYLIHVYRSRLEYPDLRRKVISLAAEHRATTVLIENAGPGMNLLQDLRAAMPQGMTYPIGVKPEGSKVDRMAAQSAKIEAGHVHLPNSAPWLGEFLTELLSFPNGRHDDQVDSVSQFLRWLQNDAYNQIPLVAPILFTRADIGLPPRHIDWSCRY
jgi:predicted phage terminase large subunit-like protein